MEEKKKCHGYREKEEKCQNDATWKVIGYSASYGVPNTRFVCDSCKDYLEKHPHPKIMEYNRFDVRFIPLNLGKCCDDMKSAIESKFLAIKYEEMLFNIARKPLSAGNVLTGEEYDPSNFQISMTLRYCPFCKSDLAYIQIDEW